MRCTVYNYGTYNYHYVKICDQVGNKIPTVMVYLSTYAGT